MPALPVSDTLKRVRDGVVSETVDREGLVAAQTPQAFLAPIAPPGVRGRLVGRHRLRVARRAVGGRVAVVDGDPRLLKVTTPADLALVESWL